MNTFAVYRCNCGVDSTQPRFNTSNLKFVMVPQLHYRREGFGPNHRQGVEHAQHLEEGHQLAAHYGKQCKAVPPLCPAVTLNRAVDAPQKYQCDDHCANQESHVGTTARLRICRDITYQRKVTLCQQQDGTQRVVPWASRYGKEHVRCLTTCHVILWKGL